MEREGLLGESCEGEDIRKTKLRMNEGHSIPGSVLKLSPCLAPGQGERVLNSDQHHRDPWEPHPLAQHEPKAMFRAQLQDRWVPSARNKKLQGKKEGNAADTLTCKEGTENHK